MLHILTPYAVDKDLGAAYNQACAMVPEGAWICLMDYDCMLLTPDAGKILNEYAANGEEALYTCYTNRCHETSAQLMKAAQDETDMRVHISFALKTELHPHTLKPITGNISGFLMMFPKSLWLKYPFIEGIGCLGCDTNFWKRLAADNVPMYIMERLYVWHTYRLTTNSKKHLL